MHAKDAGTGIRSPQPENEHDRPRRIRICALDELRKTGWTTHVDGGLELIAGYIDNEVKVYEGVCPHRGGPLFQGNCRDGEVECPWHGCRFSLRDGRLNGSKITALKSYTSMVEDGSVYVMV
jgi:nitrite reductase/ring-hydroxylating ferredoxin subunit